MNCQISRPVLIRCLFYCSVAVSIILFYQFGRNLWHPIVSWARGAYTVEDRIIQLGPKVRAEYPMIDELTDGRDIALVVLKNERVVELWKNMEEGWHLVKSFEFTGYSGRLGPKLREGDGQIPEGIYRIEYLNPNSAFYLSMKVDYPNEFDRKMGEIDGRDNLGFDIFIHGKSATIGCIPVGDEAIEELFYIIAENGYPNTRVIISPYDMRKGEMDLEIMEIEWENRLYEIINHELSNFSGDTSL